MSGSGSGTPTSGTAVSTATLASMIDEVLAALWDADQRIWPDAAITKAIRFALSEYSKRNPCSTITTLTLAAGGREISLSNLDQPLDVSEVWFPYTAADPEYPPNAVSFRVLWNEGTPTLLLDTPTEPETGDTLRVFWTHHHTLDGLDGATADSFMGYIDGTLVRLAAGYAAFSFAAILLGTGTINSDIANKLYMWGLLLINEWRSANGLEELKSSGLSFSLNASSKGGIAGSEFAFMENITLEYLATNKIRVPYSASRVPRVEIDGFILEAAADVDLASSITGAAAARYIFAVRTPGSTTFTIAQSTSRTAAAQQRLIGSCYFDGTDITEVYDQAFNVSADVRDALEAATSPSAANAFITDSAADALITAHNAAATAHAGSIDPLWSTPADAIPASAEIEFTGASGGWVAYDIATDLTLTNERQLLIQITNTPGGNFQIRQVGSATSWIPASMGIYIIKVSATGNVEVSHTADCTVELKVLATSPHP